VLSFADARRLILDWAASNDLALRTDEGRRKLFAVGNADTPGVRLERSVMDVTPLAEADPDWSFRDAAGHLHRWDLKEGKQAVRGVQFIETVPAVEGCPAQGEFRCRQCGEAIQLGWRSPTSPIYAYGLVGLYLDGRLVYEFSYSEALELSRELAEIYGE
jgi:hypothetical protein